MHPENIAAWYLRRGKKWRWVIWVFVALAIAIAAAWYFITQAKEAEGIADTLDGQADENRTATTQRDGELEEKANYENDKRKKADQDQEAARGVDREAHARVAGADSFESVDAALDAISRGARSKPPPTPRGPSKPPRG